MASLCSAFPLSMHVLHHLVLSSISVDIGSGSFRDPLMQWLAWLAGPLTGSLLPDSRKRIQFYQYLWLVSCLFILMAVIYGNKRLQISSEAHMLIVFWFVAGRACMHHPPVSSWSFELCIAIWLTLINLRNPTEMTDLQPDLRSMTAGLTGRHSALAIKLHAHHCNMHTLLTAFAYRKFRIR